MAEIRINPDDPTADDGAGDVEMQGGDDDVVEVGETGGAGAEEGDTAAAEEAAAQQQEARVTFVECVKDE